MSCCPCGYNWDICRGPCGPRSENIQAQIPQRRRSHYHFLEEHFDTILSRMGKHDVVGKYGSFVSSGDKYRQYQDKWGKANIPYFHGAAMYHLMEMFYLDEIRQTKNGWVDPWQWVIDNYNSGHTLSQYMNDLT